MAEKLSIITEWEVLEAGTPEDRATFSALGIVYNDPHTNGIWLTEAEDSFAGIVRQKVHLSAYRLAEWFAWNWWRLRWEPRRRSANWSMTHQMSTIGGGYIWPNITIFSDGERVAFDTQPTEKRMHEPLRYIGQYAAIVPASEFETALDSFIDLVCAKLAADKVADTNLEVTWKDLHAERRNPITAKRRKLEALLGYDPDEADEHLIDRLLQEAAEFGEDAIQELAAESIEGTPPTAEEIKIWAKDAGIDTDPRDAVALRDRSEQALPTKVAAWQRGAAAAKAIRGQERLDSHPISNNRLCSMLGTSTRVLAEKGNVVPFAFELDDNSRSGRIAMRSRNPMARRFDLARLLGDRIAGTSAGKLMPATRSYTYRQKMQRSFAAELLCPFGALADMLEGDFSDDAITNAAVYFQISEMSVRTILANRKLIDREDVVATA